jgi:hypothetical protein
MPREGVPAGRVVGKYRAVVGPLFCNYCRSVTSRGPMVKDEGYKEFERSGLNTTFLNSRIVATIKTDYSARTCHAP